MAVAGIDDPRFEARLLCTAATGLDRAAQLRAPDTILDEGQAATLKGLIARRAAREPIAYILKHREFYGLDFEVGPGVLVPRPETELLVEAGLAALPDGPARILDLGTGSGCILAALLTERPAAFGVGVDRSAAALRVARRNVDRHGLAGRAALVRGDWGAALKGGFDLVVANPPYITASDHDGLIADVRAFEPRAALVGGGDGLDAYRAIAVDLPRLLKPEGTIALEVGRGQAEAVRGLLVARGLTLDRTRRDLAGIERCVIARFSEGSG